MWQDEGIFGFAMTVGRSKYIFKDKVIIKIFEDVILTFSEPKKRYFAEIIYPNEDKFNREKIYDSDLTSLKFKSLVKAKDLGWNIKELKF